MIDSAAIELLLLFAVCNCLGGSNLNLGVAVTPLFMEGTAAAIVVGVARRATTGAVAGLGFAGGAITKSNLGSLAMSGKSICGNSTGGGGNSSSCARCCSLRF